jgi:hypothetical protein
VRPLPLQLDKDASTLMAVRLRHAPSLTTFISAQVSLYSFFESTVPWKPPLFLVKNHEKDVRSESQHLDSSLRAPSPPFALKG